jgi:hypothetical protein
MNHNHMLTPAQIQEIKDHLGLIIQAANTTSGKRLAGDIEKRCEIIRRLLPQPAPASDMRKAFERWMLDVARITIGSKDPHPAGLERDYWRVWQAAWQALSS